MIRSSHRHPRSHALRATLALLIWLPAVPACLFPAPEENPLPQEQAPEAPSRAALLEAPFPLEEIARYPLPGTSTPGGFGFTEDGKELTFLDSADGSLTRQLYAMNLETGERRQVVEPPGEGETEENLSLEEKLRRERMRERGLGITSYAWSRRGDRMLVPIRGSIYVKEGISGELRPLVELPEGASPCLDPQLTRDGSHVAYVQDHEVYVVPFEGGEPRQITGGARGTGKTHGLAEYVAQEEMGRFHGFWWSRSGTHVAFAEVDETHIPQYRIVHQGKDAVGEGAQEDHGYPFAGAANAKVRLGVVSRDGGKPVWMDLGLDDPPESPHGPEDIYLARVHWMPGGELWAEVEDRRQQRLDLVRFDPKTGARSTVLSERSEVWINLHRLFVPLEETEGEAAGGFVWGSERSGFMHLYLYDAQGKELRPLTSGDWMVESVEVDEKAGQVYFTGTKDGPTQRHLYTVPLAGGEPRKLTSAPGTHSVVLSPDFTHFVDMHSDLAAPTVVVVRKLADGAAVQTVHDEVDPRVESLTLPPPELVTLESRDGVELHGAIYRPPAEAGDGPFPTLVSVYGGPHAQRVSDSWGMTVDMRAQYLRGRGYLVFKLDNRGSSRRGLAFEGALRHDMGNIEVQDQVDGVRWLVEQGLADPARVGIYGWSYGGYMSAMALVRAPETFQVGVAGAPVTHWDGYDTHYTERYMGLPQENAEGYERSSVMAHVDALAGDLLLVHGLIDENVHFRHTARLINALIHAGKDYELLLFPDERHMPRSLEDRVYMELRIDRYLEEHLANREPRAPANRANEG